MRRAVLAIGLVVVLAGCSSAIAPPGGTATEETSNGTTAEERSIAVEGGSIPVDHTTLFDDVTRMLAVDAAPPDTIYVEPDSEMGIQKEPMNPFFRLVGIERSNDADRTATALGYVSGPQSVYVNEKVLMDEEQVTLTLVHEYVHVVQGRTDAIERLNSAIDDPKSTDGMIVRHAVLEGPAVSAETRIWTQRGYDGSTPAAGMSRSYETTSGAKQWIYARYYFGYEYLQTRNVSMTAIDDLYDSPPRTSEELIHGMAAGSEPLPPLSVAVESAEWDVRSRDRTGELFVRVALDTEVSANDATEAAAGWGTDTRVELSSDEERAYVWALRWDDATNATEFEETFQEYLDERATKNDGVWIDDDAAFSYTRVDDETAVVFLGSESFVRTASVEGTNESVRVTT